MATSAAQRWTTWQAPRPLDPYRPVAAEEGAVMQASWSVYNLRGSLGSTQLASTTAMPRPPLWISSGAEPSAVAGVPSWWSSPWDSPEGTRAVLLRQIPGHLASLDIVRGWCTLYGDVASVRITKSDPTAIPATGALSITEFINVRASTAFAVIQFFKETSAIMAVQHLEKDVFNRIGSRVFAMPFPTITTDEILEQQACPLSTVVIVGVSEVGLQELMDAIKVKALGVRGAFVTSRSASTASASATDASDALSIVLQFDDTRMATNVKRHFAERVQGALQVYYWDGADLAWPVIVSWPSSTVTLKPATTTSSAPPATPAAFQAVPTPTTPATAAVPTPTLAIRPASTDPWAPWNGLSLLPAAAAPAHSIRSPVTPPTSPAHAEQAAPYASAARRGILTAGAVPLAPIGTPPARPTPPSDTTSAPFTPPRTVLATPPETPPSPAIQRPSTASASTPTSSPPKTTARLPTIINVDALLRGEDDRTTLMVKNIPNKYCPRMLVDLLNATHHGRYTTLYLPMDYKNICNMGYFFLDVVNARSDIPGLMTRFQGLRWPRFNSVKTADIVFADIQGQDALLAQFATSKIQWTARRFNPYRPRLFYTSGPNAGEEKYFFTVTPEEARNGPVLELRPGRPIDPSIADDIVIVSAGGSTSTAQVATAPPSPTQKENEDPSMQAGRRCKLGRMLDATAQVAATATSESIADPVRVVVVVGMPTYADAELW